MSATYEFYTQTFLGRKIPEDVFAYYAARAGEFITARYGSVPAGEMLDKAVCACAEVCYSSEPGTVLSSEKVGDYSVTYSGGADMSQSLESRLVAVLSVYLPAVGWC